MKVTKTVSPCGYIEYRNEDGQFHREDGPAVVRSNGHKEYWLEGQQYSYEKWLDRVTNPIMYKWREFCGTL